MHIASVVVFVVCLQNLRAGAKLLSPPGLLFVVPRGQRIPRAHRISIVEPSHVITTSLDVQPVATPTSGRLAI